MLCIRNAPASIISNVLPDQCNISAILLSIYIIELFTVVNTDRHTRLFCSNNLTLMSAAILNFELPIKLHLVTEILDHSDGPWLDHGNLASQGLIPPRATAKTLVGAGHVRLLKFIA